jgi:tripartite-type tricarboxylate transporter receptor subunit TctC
MTGDKAVQINRRTLMGAAAGLVGSVVLPSRADEWPNKPVRIVLGYTTGGSTDATARIVGRPLETKLKQPVIMEYKPGAGASIGAEFVARSAADGYTIGLSDSGPLSIMPHLRKVAYDPTADFTPLSYVCTTGLAVLVHPSVDAKNLRELMALVKSRPGKLNYASSGVGSVHHLAGELFKVRTQSHLVHIPYRGAAPALTDLVAGQVPVMFATIGPALPMIAAGKARVLAVTSSQRSTALPDVPTLAEAGLPGYEAVLRFVMVGPPQLPAAVAARLQAELAQIITDPAVVRELVKLGNDEISPRTPAEVQTLLQQDLKKWGDVIRSAKITLDT